MSYYSSSRRSPGRDSSRHSSNRRGMSPPRRTRYDHSQSPGPSRNRAKSPVDENALPSQFGRIEDRKDLKDDNLTVLQRMKTAFVDCPLGLLTKCLDDKLKLKVWTRNHKEVRGICTCTLIAFDKHWNLLVQDVDEVYIRPRKNKTPFLRDIGPNENIPEMQPRVPKQRTEPQADEQKPVVKAEQKSADEADPDNKSGDKSGAEKKKRRKRKKPGPISERRHFPNYCIIRGDNLVMISPVKDEEEEG